MARVSVITLTLNEEHNIAECLESVRWADELIVIDSLSTDTTVACARAFTPSVFSIPWKGYGAARNEGIARATGDWILWLDADERVTPELAREIQETVRLNDPAYAGYDVPRRAYFLGRWIRHSGWYPSRVTRLFRASTGTFNDQKVHEQLKIEGKIGSLRGDILHYTDPDLEHYFGKFNTYTSLAAEDMHAAGRQFSITDLLIRPPFQFLKMYLLRFGFLDGLQGFILAIVSSAYVFTKYAKLWERHRADAKHPGKVRT